jgi:AcrR family transcriptional regulator
MTTKASGKKRGARGTAKKSAVKTTKPRAVGRPARLSREAILAASIELLESESVEAFTLARVARKLDTVSMALYNYFPSREALINAVADDVCMRFKMPRTRAGQPWQKTLRAWLDGLRTLAEQQPVILQVLGIDGKTTAGWLRVSIHVSRTLYNEGMRGRALALNSYLFCSHAVALVMFENVEASFHSTLSLSHLDELEPDEQNFLLEQLRPYHVKLSRNEVLEAGFDQLIGMLELELAKLKR